MNKNIPTGLKNNIEEQRLQLANCVYYSSEINYCSTYYNVIRIMVNYCTLISTLHTYVIMHVCKYYIRSGNDDQIVLVSESP